MKRQVPEYASQANKGKDRAAFAPKLRSGDELITLKERNAKKAIRSPTLAKRPDIKPLFKGSKDYEPQDKSGKVFKSPVFLVDPKFTKKQKAEEKVDFTDNDFGGHDVPVNPTRWPYVNQRIQDFYKVGPDCACTGKPVKGHDPRWLRLDVGDAYEAVWEPLSDEKVKKMAKNNQRNCYQGDDFGGNNIPFPHPTPPKPDAYYDDAFLDILSFSTSVEEPKFVEPVVRKTVVREAKVEEEKPKAEVKVETPKWASKAVEAPKAVEKVEEKAVEKDDVKKSVRGYSEVGYGPYESVDDYSDDYYGDAYGYDDGYYNDGYYNDGYANDGYYGDSYGNDYGYGYANDGYDGEYDSFNTDDW